MLSYGPWPLLAAGPIFGPQSGKPVSSPVSWDFTHFPVRYLYSRCALFAIKLPQPLRTEKWLWSPARLSCWMVLAERNDLFPLKLSQFRSEFGQAGHKLAKLLAIRQRFSRRISRGETQGEEARGPGKKGFSGTFRVLGRRLAFC